jgi:hypothetical protein
VAGAVDRRVRGADDKAAAVEPDHDRQVVALMGEFVKSPGPNPTTSSYNASVVNFYNTTGSLARFES